jgi:hypothetical protein
MNILRRNPPHEDKAAKKPPVGNAGAQRIEVTVEQEWVSMLVRRPADATAAAAQANPEEPAVEKHVAGAERGKLPPPPGGK